MGRMVTAGGLMFATSYDTSAVIEVRKCIKINKKRNCESLPTLGTLVEKTEESKWYQQTTATSKQVFIKIINANKESYTEIGDTKLPFRKQKKTTRYWYEIENTGSESPVPLDLPAAL